MAERSEAKSAKRQKLKFDIFSAYTQYLNRLIENA